MLALALALLAYAALPISAVRLCQAPPLAEEQAHAFVRVVDENGEPVPAVSVYVYMTPEQSNLAGADREHGRVVHTDSGGEVSFDFAPTLGSSLWILRKSGFGEVLHHELVGHSPGELVDLDFTLRLREDAMLHAVALDAVTGEPIKGATIDSYSATSFTMIAAITEAAEPSLSPAAKSGEDGRFSVPAATFAGSTLRIFAPGYAPRVLSVGGDSSRLKLANHADPAHQPHRILLEKGAELQVTLMDAVDARGVEVVYSIDSLLRDESPLSLRGDLTLMRVQGEYIDSDPESDSRTYLLSGLPPTAYGKICFLGAKGEVLREDDVRMPATGRLVRRTYDLSTDGALMGTLLDASGAPVPGLEIWLGIPSKSQLRFTQNQKPIQKTATDAHGVFRFKGLAVANYLVAPAPGHALGLRLPKEVTPGARFAITTHDKSVHVGLKGEPAFSITGRLEDHGGSPIGGLVVAERVGAPWEAQDFSSAGRTTFEIGGLRAGTYRVWGRANGVLLARSIDVTAGARDVRIKAQPTGSVSGRVEDAVTGKHVSGALVWFQDAGTGAQLTRKSQRDGTFFFPHVTAGKHQLIGWTHEGLVSAPVLFALVPHQSLKDLVVKMQQGAILNLTTTENGHRNDVEITADTGLLIKSRIDVAGHGRLTVPAGSVHVRVLPTEAHRAAQLTLQLEPGEVREVTVELGPVKGATPRGGVR